MGDLFGLAAVAAEEDRSVGLDTLVLAAAEQSMDRLAKVLSFQVPQRHIDRGHGGDGDRRAAEVERAAVHLLPQPLGFQRVFAQEHLAQPAGDVVAEGSIDDGFDHFGLRIRFANPFQPVVGTNAHKHCILAAGGFVLDVRDAEELADDFGDFHDTSLCEEVSRKGAKPAKGQCTQVATLFQVDDDDAMDIEARNGEPCFAIAARCELELLGFGLLHGFADFVAAE